MDCVVCGGLSCGLCSSCGASIKFARHPRERGENKTIFALLAYMGGLWPGCCWRWLAVGVVSRYRDIHQTQTAVGVGRRAASGEIGRYKRGSNPRGLRLIRTRAKTNKINTMAMSYVVLFIIQV